MSIACSQCGTLVELAPLRPGTRAECPTCANPLERTVGRSLSAALACALATFILLFPANMLPLLSVAMLGMHRESRLLSGITMLWAHHWPMLAILIGAFAFVLPFIRYGLLALVLVFVRVARRPPGLGMAFRWAMALDPWSMPDVFLIGLAIGYSRVAATLSVRLEWGGLCFIAAALLAMVARATLDPRTVWRAIGPEESGPAPAQATISCTACDLVVAAANEGSRCPRCALTLHARKPDSLARTIALLVAGFVLFIPANVYPMSTDLELGAYVPHRIVDGIRELYEAGLWPLGILIFCTSIAIPFLKLAGLGWLLVSTRRRSVAHLRLKTRLYRFIEEIGRWSSTDVFTIAVFLPLIQFGALATARAARGAVAFILVVILTMLASRVFDPRLMWDAGLENERERRV